MILSLEESTDQRVNMKYDDVVFILDVKPFKDTYIFKASTPTVTSRKQHYSVHQSVRLLAIQDLPKRLMARFSRPLSNTDTQNIYTNNGWDLIAAARQESGSPAGQDLCKASPHLKYLASSRESCSNRCHIWHAAAVSPGGFGPYGACQLSICTGARARDDGSVFSLY